MVSGAEAVDLTEVYALGDNETEAPETGYSTEIPTGKDPGTYYVWYRVEEDGTAVSKARCVVAAIAGKPVSITAKDQTVSVKGKIRQGVGMVDVSGILEGHRLMKVKLVSSGTAAVTSEGIIIPSDAVILAREGNVTGNYDITYEPGVLTVKKAQSKPSYDDPTEKGDEDEKEDQDEEEEDNGDKEDKEDKPDKETDPDKPEEVRYFAEWVNGKWYNKDGTQTYRPKAVWKRNEKGSYYIDDAGWYPRSRWQKIDGIWYYFNAEGYVVQGEYVQGWWLDRVSGRWTYPYRATWHKNNRGWWYGDSTGWYAKNRTYIIDGKVYKFDADGYLIEN